jgi:hypothetical protein
MHVTKYGILVGLLVIMITSALFGAHFGYTVNGAPAIITMSEAPGEMNLWDWIWNGAEFLFNMVTFQIDDMPVVVNSLFLIMSLLVVVIIVSLVRGTE